MRQLAITRWEDHPYDQYGKPESFRSSAEVLKKDCTKAMKPFHTWLQEDPVKKGIPPEVLFKIKLIIVQATLSMMEQVAITFKQGVIERQLSVQQNFELEQAVQIEISMERNREQEQEQEQDQKQQQSITPAAAVALLKLIFSLKLLGQI